jgi:hypothetical protein
MIFGYLRGNFADFKNGFLKNAFWFSELKIFWQSWSNLHSHPRKGDQTFVLCKTKFSLHRKQSKNIAFGSRKLYKVVKKTAKSQQFTKKTYQ